MVSECKGTTKKRERRRNDDKNESACIILPVPRLACRRVGCMGNVRIVYQAMPGIKPSACSRHASRGLFPPEEKLFSSRERKYSLPREKTKPPRAPDGGQAWDVNIFFRMQVRLACMSSCGDGGHVRNFQRVRRKPTWVANYVGGGMPEAANWCDMCPVRQKCGAQSAGIRKRMCTFVHKFRAYGYYEWRNE